MAKTLAIKNLPFKHGEIIKIKIISISQRKVSFQDEDGNVFLISRPSHSDWEGISKGDEGNAFMRRYISSGNEYGQIILF